MAEHALAATRIDEFKAERRQLARSIANTMDARARLAIAENAENAAIANIAGIGRAEADRALAWARANDGTDFPTPDVDARAAADRELAQAQARAEACKAAFADLEAEHAQIASEIRSLSAKIAVAAIDVVVGEHDRLRDEATAQAAEVERRVAEVYAARVWLVEHAAKLRNEGSPLFTLFLSSAERLSSYGPIETSPTTGSVAGKVTGWSARYLEIIDG